MQTKLTTQCDDDVGLIAKITGLCYEHNLNITRNNEFVDKEAKRFFMRTELTGEPSEAFLEQLKSQLPSGAKVELFEQALNIEVQAVIANYPDLEKLVLGFDIPFHCISHEGLSRAEHDKLVGDAIAQYQPDIIGLAKYMRILSPEFVARFENKVINIHHSFLPAFIGAKPYHQAFDRGVKIVGATAHFVNNELDEGPIIAQNVTPVTHIHNAEAMAKIGRDIEKTVFCNALQLASEQKLFINGNRTVVFS